MLKLWTIEEKKDTELILHVWFSKSNFSEEIDDVKRMLKASGVTGAGRKVLITQAGQEGPIVLLVVFVLNVDDGGINGLSMLATMFSRPNVQTDFVFMKLNFFISSTG
jgi:hypothetical protein